MQGIRFAYSRSTHMHISWNMCMQRYMYMHAYLYTYIYTHIYIYYVLKMSRARGEPVDLPSAKSEEAGWVLGEGFAAAFALSQLAHRQVLLQATFT